MAELTVIDLESYTNGRLAKNNYETARVLAAALAKVRAYCRWHVTPVVTNDQVTLDGPGDWGGWGVGAGYTYGGTYYGSGSALQRIRVGGQVLYLPTKKLQTISSIVEDGSPLDMTNISWTERGEVIKLDHTRWSVNFNAIQVTFTHGYTEAQAADWRRIVLAVADRMSLVRGLVGPFDLTVGPYRMHPAAPEVNWLDDLLSQIDTNLYVRPSV